MCSQSSFVKDLLLQRLSGSTNTPAPVMPADKKEAVQSMVRRRVIGLDRSCMVSVCVEQKKSLCLNEQESVKHQKILTPEELKLKKSLREFQAAKLEEINAKACRTEEYNVHYAEKMLKVKKKLLEEKQCKLLKKMQKIENNARLSSIKYQEWLKKQAKKRKKQMDQECQIISKNQISDVCSSVHTGKQTVSSNDTFSALPLSINFGHSSSSGYCKISPSNCPPIKFDAQYSSKYENEVSQFNALNETRQNMVNSDSQLDVCSADNDSPASDVLDHLTAATRTSCNTSGDGIFATIPTGCGSQPSTASPSLEPDGDEPSQLFAGEEIDSSCRPVDDLLEENDAFARLLEMVDGFPANNEGASALRVLCTLDQSTIASLLSNKTLYWTPAGKMILRIFKQRDEPLIPAPVQRAFETRTDDGGWMCGKVLPRDTRTGCRESSCRAPAGIKPSSSVTRYEGSAGFANTSCGINPNIEYANQQPCCTNPGTCDTAEERVVLPIIENLPCDEEFARLGEKGEEQATLPSVPIEAMNSKDDYETDLSANSRLPTNLYSNHDFSDHVPLNGVMSSTLNATCSYLELQCANSLVSQLLIPDQSKVPSDGLSIYQSASSPLNYNDASASAIPVVTDADSAISFQNSMSRAEDFLGDQSGLRRSVQTDCIMHTIDESDVVAQVPCGLISQTYESPDESVIFLEKQQEFLGCQSKMGEACKGPVVTPASGTTFETEVSSETSFVRELVSQVPQEHNPVAMHCFETIREATNSYDGFNSSSSLKNNSLPVCSVPDEGKNRKSVKLKCHRGIGQVPKFRFSSHDSLWKTSRSTCDDSSLGVGSVSSVAYVECELPEPQDTCQSNQLTQEEFEAINGDGSGPIMLQILP